MKTPFKLTDEDVELAGEIASEARSLHDAARLVLSKIGWQQDFASGDWRIERRCEGEFGQELRRPISITSRALYYLADRGLDRLCPQLEIVGCPREAAIIEQVWLQMPDFIKEDRCHTAQDMELEIGRRLARGRQP